MLLLLGASKVMLRTLSLQTAAGPPSGVHSADKLPKGPCSYIVYDWGPTGLPYNYLRAQVHILYSYMGSSGRQIQGQRLEPHV